MGAFGEMMIRNMGGDLDAYRGNKKQVTPIKKVKKKTNMVAVGSTFKSKWFEGVVEVTGMNEEKNELEVYISRGEHGHPETWNLAHTEVGFDRGDYFYES